MRLASSRLVEENFDAIKIYDRYVEYATILQKSIGDSFG
jgi:hypothetical protein